MGVQSVADDGGFSLDFDLICGASFYTALGQYLLPGVLLSVERHCDLLLAPRLEMATIWHNIKDLQKEKQDPVSSSSLYKSSAGKIRSSVQLI